MISDSSNRLFGGANAILIDKVKRIIEGCHKDKMQDDSVSDLEQKAKGKEELNEIDDKSKLEESQDYIPFMKRDDWEDQVSKSSLKPSDGGNNRIEALDDSGNTQGWWNDHTGVGYIHKHCCEPTLQESRRLSGIAKERADRERKQYLDDIKSGKDYDIKDDMVGAARVVKDQDSDDNRELHEIDGNKVVATKKSNDVLYAITQDKTKFPHQHSTRYSIDSGKTWNLIDTHPSRHLADLHFNEEYDESNIRESQVDPLKPNAVGDAIVTDQPIKN